MPSSPPKALDEAAPEMQNAHPYKLFCEEGDEVSKSEIAYGYRLKGHDYPRTTLINSMLCSESSSPWPP